MKYQLLNLLFAFTKLFPSYAQGDLTKLSKFQQAIIGMRVWITYRMLDEKNSSHEKGPNA
ncbi:MAG: hypothetical protein HKN32_02635 [Flavobacteriales bacterium]|nr:hypothetical protein [Flavobacteriales bacterium]